MFLYAVRVTYRLTVSSPNLVTWIRAEGAPNAREHAQMFDTIPQARDAGNAFAGVLESRGNRVMDVSVCIAAR